MSEVTIVNYGTGNLRSIVREIDQVGGTARIASTAAEVGNASRIILPGVGHFATAMRRLSDLGMLEALREAIFTKRTPVLGICLGMQLLACSSEEGDAAGLAVIDARVARFVVDATKYKVPHIGWNTLDIVADTRILAGVRHVDEFYFVHAYRVICADQADVAATTDYGTEFASVVERDNIFGVQFHPEKSRNAGLTIFRNFLNV